MKQKLKKKKDRIRQKLKGCTPGTPLPEGGNDGLPLHSNGTTENQTQNKGDENETDY